MEVTSRLEAMLARIKGIKEISSTSGNGWGRITLELDKHTNIDAARFEASTIVRQTWPDLPEELSYPILEMSRPDDKEIEATAITPTPLGEGKPTTSLGVIVGQGRVG